MNNKKRLYVDIHVLQTVPPSCVNRDDTGSPKTAVYGGVTRARVSSQSWKRAVRLYFRELFDSEELALRTKKLVSIIATEIEKLSPDAGDAEKKAEKILKSAGVTVKKQKKDDDELTAGALFFISHAQARALAELAVNDSDTIADKLSSEAKDKVLAAFSDEPGIEIALFGRMVAENPTLNTDACAQVAHAISTHKISNEYDYFTAIDDMAPEDNAGAAHLGTVEYNSSTLYRYATVAVHELEKKLGDDTANAVSKFVCAFACSMPTGKQNTFANRTLPDAIMVSLRTDQPVNLVGAFEKPVRLSENGYVEPSAKKLENHARKVYGDFAGSPAVTYVTGDILSGLAEPMPFKELLDKLADDVSVQLAKEGE